MPETLDADAVSFFEAGGRGVYLIKACGACGTNNESALIACKQCGSDDLAFTEASGAAVLIGATTAYRTFDPLMEASLPYEVGVARLAEGPLAVGRISGSAGNYAAIGSAVRIEFEQVAGRLVPVFKIPA